MPEYHDEGLAGKSFKFLPGWLDGFKKRWNIKKRKQYGELKSVDVENAQERMREIHEIVKKYPVRRVYNCDESGLFWKMTPEWTLASQPQNGSKKEKIRMTLHFTCNGDGSHKLAPWIIGHLASLRPFGKDNYRIRNLRMVYTSNPTAWMTAGIFIDYLTWFDSQMTEPSLLLMDNFRPHEAAWEDLRDEVIPKLKLKWTRVEFLPKNSTSRHQPLDQGIIANFKVFYRALWIDFILSISE